METQHKLVEVAKSDRLDQMEAQRESKPPKVDDVVRVQTQNGWKLAKVAKVRAAGVLLATLVSGTEAGPVCAAAVVTICGVAGLGCVAAGWWNGGALSLPCIAQISPVCSTGVAGCLSIPTPI